MLGALQRSLTAQRQLVSDASYELRTPLTSLQLNGSPAAWNDDGCRRCAPGDGQAVDWAEVTSSRTRNPTAAAPSAG